MSMPVCMSKKQRLKSISAWNFDLGLCQMLSYLKLIEKLGGIDASTSLAST